MSDLTERLAAAGVPTCRTIGYCSGCYEFRHTVAREAANILPLFLSEPELVAGLADEVRLSVLTERERAVMKLGEGVANVSGKIRLDLSVTVDNALAEVRALTPEVGND